MLKINHNPKSYKVFTLLSIDEVRKAWDSKAERLPLNDTYSVNLKSQRLQLFFRKGMTCVSCGVKGEYFSAETAKYGNDKNPHLNLYTEQGILLTKDHIKPKSKGGKDHFNNYQTMCSPCNWNKGNKEI